MPQNWRVERASVREGREIAPQVPTAKTGAQHHVDAINQELEVTELRHPRENDCLSLHVAKYFTH